MKSAITVATIAIATIVNRSGWVAWRNVDGLDPVTPLAGLTAMRRIVAADSGLCDAPRAKLRETKQQLRKRMHDSVRQTGQWRKSGARER